VAGSPISPFFERGLAGVLGKKKNCEKSCVPPAAYKAHALGVLLARMNDLGANYRENKAKIDKLRRQFVIVRQPVPL
jgi:hypothetical protein